jgi:hypothetical protein
MSSWRDAECLDTLGFHLCDGKLMSCQGLLYHLQSKKSSCYFHLGILHVLKNLYGNGKKCPPIASRLVRSKRDLEYMSVRGSLHVRDEALDESMSQKISSNHGETKVTEEELQYLVPDTIPTKSQSQAYYEVETSDVLEGISTSHYLEMVSLIPDCLSLGDKTVDNDKTAHTAHPLVSDVDNIKCNEVTQSQTLSSPSVRLDEFESETKMIHEVMNTRGSASVDNAFKVENNGSRTTKIYDTCFLSVDDFDDSKLPSDVLFLYPFMGGSGVENLGKRVFLGEEEFSLDKSKIYEMQQKKCAMDKF